MRNYNLVMNRARRALIYGLTNVFKSAKLLVVNDKQKRHIKKVQAVLKLQPIWSLYLAAHEASFFISERFLKTK